MDNLNEDEKTDLLDNLFCAVLLLDTDFRVQYLNQAAEMFLGSSSQRIIGCSVFDFIDDKLLEPHFYDCLQSRQVHSLREGQLRLLGHGKSHKSPVKVDCIFTPRFENEKVKGLIWEVSQIGRQLRIARDEQLLAQQSTTHEIIRGLAHEIKNPLGGLRGAAQLLESELHDEELKEYTQIIISEADRLKNLVNRMLGPKRNRLPEQERVNIHEVLQHVRQLVAPSMSSDAQIKADYDPSIPDFYAVRDQLVQAVLNIMANAIRAAGDKGEIILRTRILRQFTVHNRYYRLVLKADIIDNGEGIPPELCNKLFFPMVSGSSGGTGLGLSIAQSLISRNKGLIEFQSKPGKTVFSILIPLEKPNEQA